MSNRIWHVEKDKYQIGDSNNYDIIQVAIGVSIGRNEKVKVIEYSAYEALQAKLDIQINATQILIDTVESYAKGHIGNMLALTKISEYEDALKQFNHVQNGSEG